jgi:hypothetical protein
MTVSSRISVVCMKSAVLPRVVANLHVKMMTDPEKKGLKQSYIVKTIYILKGGCNDKSIK